MVATHAVQMGPIGNIRAGDIYGPCCRVNVLVQNTDAFVGGQNARTYPMVTRSDLSNTTNALTATLTQSVQAALSTQVHADETLIVPVPCTPQVQSSQQVGEEATHVTVQVSDTCTGETYSTQAVQETMTQAVTQAAQTQLGSGYVGEGPIQVTVQHVRLSTGPHGSLMLEVTGTGCGPISSHRTIAYPCHPSGRNESRTGDGGAADNSRRQSGCHAGLREQ